MTPDESNQRQERGRQQSRMTERHTSRKTEAKIKNKKSKNRKDRGGNTQAYKSRVLNVLLFVSHTVVLSLNCKSLGAKVQMFKTQIKKFVLR